MAHTWHDHRGQGTSGRVRQGRFQSSVIQDDDHALVVLRYIGANPLRSGMVADLSAYPKSSYRVHGLGRTDPLLSPLPLGQALGRDDGERQAFWRRWVHAPLTAAELAAARQSVVSGRP